MNNREKNYQSVSSETPIESTLKKSILNLTGERVSGESNNKFSLSEKKSSILSESHINSYNAPFSMRKSNIMDKDNSKNDNQFGETIEPLDSPNIPIQSSQNLSQNDDEKVIRNEKPRVKNKEKLITSYKEWSGYNYFFLNGAIFEGPCNIRPSILTGTILLIQTILFVISDAKFLSKKLTIAIPIIEVVLFFACFILLIIFTFCEPGVIRKFIVNDQRKDWEKSVGRVFHLGYIFDYKYCVTCRIIKPHRSHHCNDCNNCVERLDHHNFWIGNCAGKRNYFYFFLFLLLFNILTLYIIGISIARIVLQAKDISDINKTLPNEDKVEHLSSYYFGESIMALYLIISNIFILILIGSLLYYHIKLVSTNTTTKELLRGKFENVQGNPFSRGCCRNCKNVLCPKVKKHDLLEILRGEFQEVSDKPKRIFQKVKPEIYEEVPKNDINETTTAPLFPTFNESKATIDPRQEAYINNMGTGNKFEIKI